MVFCFEYCSGQLWEKLWEYFIQKVIGQNNSWNDIFKSIKEGFAGKYIETNNWDIETYRKKLEKKIVNTYSFFFSGKCLWLCLWKLGPPVSRRLPSRSWRGSSWGHSIEKFDSWYEKRYEQYQTILDPITLWIMQVWNGYDCFSNIHIFCTYFTWLERRLE